MTEQHQRLRDVSWLDLCPWLLLARVPALALRLEVLLLASLGGLLSAAGWWLVGLVFFYGGPPTTDDVLAAADVVQPARVEQAERFRTLFEHLQSWPGSAVAPLIFQSPMLVQSSWSRLAGPYVAMFAQHITLRQFAYLLTGGMLSLAIWSIFGGAITRCAAMQLGREERIGLRASLGYALSKAFSYFSAPLYPLLGMALFVLGVWLLVGLPMNLDLGLLWAGIVWIFVLVFGLLAALLALGLFFGWPLMWATISSEGSDAFDALSRSFAYTFQRPFYYLFYVLFAGLLGTLAWLLVLQFGEAVIHLSLWAAHWGVLDEKRMALITAVANGQTIAESDFSTAADAGVWLIALGNRLVRAIAFSFAFGYFWVAASGIYLLLRREVDHTETDEIYIDDDNQTYGLPPLDRDEHGVPGVAKHDRPPHSPSVDPHDLASGQQAE